MGHKGEATLERFIGVFQLQMPIAFGKRRKNFTEMTIHCGESLHKGVLTQGGDRLNPKQ